MNVIAQYLNMMKKPADVKIGRQAFKK